MRLGFIHLTGPRRGAREFFDEPVIQIGTAAGAQVCVDGAAGVEPFHAQVLMEEEGPRLVPRAPLRLNHRPAGAALLADGDLLEIGSDTSLRIQLGRTAPRRAGTLAWRAFLAGAATAAILLGATYALHLRGRMDEETGRQEAALQARDRRIASLSAAVDSLEIRSAKKQDVEARVGEVQRAMAAVETTVLARLGSEVERSVGRNPEIAAAVAAARRLESMDEAVGRIITRLGKSVCVIQGSLAFGRERDGEWHFLRHIEAETAATLQVEEDKLPLTLDGEGRLFQIDYTGTGFLAAADGRVVTSRHIAEPWWRSEAAAPLLEGGYTPRLLYLRAYFPGSATPVQFLPERTRVSPHADVAVLGFLPGGPLPDSLPLAAPDEVAVGRRVVLLGYPSGLSALIAKSEDALADELAATESIDPMQLLDDLAARGMVRPLPTQGSIGDLLKDKVIYDAETAVGGSGGPVLDLEGRVVAVNYGLLKAFRGANFGVPVSFARALLAE